MYALGGGDKGVCILPTFLFLQISPSRHHKMLVWGGGTANKTIILPVAQRLLIEILLETNHEILLKPIKKCVSPDRLSHKVAPFLSSPLFAQ